MNGNPSFFGAESRIRAANLLDTYFKTGDFPSYAVSSSGLHDPLTDTIISAVLRNQSALKWMMKQLVRKPPAPEIYTYLLIGAGQIFYIDQVPDHAAVHETVEAAKKKHSKNSIGFINGVLRNMLRKKDLMLEELNRQSLPTRYSHPNELLHIWRSAYGPENTEALCAWDNTPPPLCIRRNIRKASRDEFTKRLAEEGAELEPHPFHPDLCFSVIRSPRLSSLPSFTEGWFYIQDPSTTMAARLLNPQPGETIIDACACPGGKTLQLAEQMEDTGRIIAMDLHTDRMRLLQQNLERMGPYKSIDIIKTDATKAWPETAGKADGILLDVPCTNTGVLRRRIEARWRFTADARKHLEHVQKRILDRAAPNLKEGGRIVYSTCSLAPEENENRIRTWLKDHTGFVLENEILLLPYNDHTDGAYAALLRKE